MLNKLLAFLRQHAMVKPGDTVICAVSGGADSVALLWGMYLLREKLQITVEAAHYNHCLRGAESQSDEDFVRAFCDRYDIHLHLGRGKVIPGEKGLEAAARDSRYAFLRGLSGIIATAHTADDNAETVLMHMLRGTGLKGLGGITPVGDRLIRPMLSVTRDEVVAFLAAYSLPYVQDSTNDLDVFLRNRLRHHVIPLLRTENPRLAGSLSAMALRLREDEQVLAQLAAAEKTLQVEKLRSLSPAIRNRVLAILLEDFGIREPSAEHIAMLQSVIDSDKPSARADFPGNITVGRRYGVLVKLSDAQSYCHPLPVGGAVILPGCNMRVTCVKSTGKAVLPTGNMVVRSRISGDRMRLLGGSKSLKKLFIDKKIPADQRHTIPVIADDLGVLWAYGFGPNLDRLASDNGGVEIRFERLEK